MSHARSRFKVPFVDFDLYQMWKKAFRAGGPLMQTEPIKSDKGRRSTIMPYMVGYKFAIHNGTTYIPMEVRENMVGYKFGEFAFTRKIWINPEKKDMMQQMKAQAAASKKDKKEGKDKDKK